MARFTRSEDDFPRSTRESRDIQEATQDPLLPQRRPNPRTGERPKRGPRPDSEPSQDAPEPRRVSRPGGDMAFSPLPGRKHVQTKPTAEQVARGAQGALEGVEFFDYQPMPFLPYSDELMRAILNDGAQGLLGRSLRSEELEEVLQLAREAEVRFWHSRQRVAEAEAATGFVSDAPTNEAAVIDSVATQILMQDPDLGSLDASELQERAEIARAEARKKFEEDFAEAERMATESFTPFREKDFQLAMQDAVSQAAPMEELGVDLRGAMEGLMGAIAGRVNQQGFVPR